MMTKEELQAKVDSMVFYHAIDLPHGITTPGWAPQWPEHYKLPADLTGKSVLDVGCYDGYWTFECLKRGASSVMAIDDFSDTIHTNEKRSWAQFDLCREALGYSGAQVGRAEMSVYGVQELGTFDLILCLGLLYHLKHPLLALERLRAACKPGALLMVESHISDDYSPYKVGGHDNLSVMEFYPGKELGGCATNWWGPTLRCLSDMMVVAGFERVQAWKVEGPQALNQTRGYAHGYSC